MPFLNILKKLLQSFCRNSTFDFFVRKTSEKHPHVQCLGVLLERRAHSSAAPDTSPAFDLMQAQVRTAIETRALTGHLVQVQEGFSDVNAAAAATDDVMISPRRGKELNRHLLAGGAAHQ